MKGKYIFLLIGIIVFGIGAYELSTDSTVLPASTFKSTALKFPNDTLYFKLKAWGIQGNKLICALSKSSLDNFDSKEDYIFNRSPVFYKTSADTLKIYCYKKAEIPLAFKTKIKIVQIELDNSQMIELISYKQYKKEGYQVIK